MGNMFHLLGFGVELATGVHRSLFLLVVRCRRPDTHGKTGSLHIATAVRRRFLEYAFSASLMLMAIGMITGLRDYNSMFGVFMLSFSVMMFGMITEMLSRPDSTLEKWIGDSSDTGSVFSARLRSYAWRMFPHFIGWFPYVAAWSIVLGNFFRQIDDLSEDLRDRIPWFVPWSIYGTAVVFTTFAFVQMRYQWTEPKHYWR